MAVQVQDRVIKHGDVCLPTDLDYYRQLERMVFTATKIRLMINPLDDAHEELLNEIEAELHCFRSSAPDYAMQADAEQPERRIASASLKLIRADWLRAQRGG